MTKARQSRRLYNRYLYLNIVTNLETQVDYWIRRADLHEGDRTFRQKAEGLGYALRLMYAFEPEFSELVELADGIVVNGDATKIDV